MFRSLDILLYSITINRLLKRNCTCLCIYNLSIYNLNLGNSFDFLWNIVCRGFWVRRGSKDFLWRLHVVLPILVTETVWGFSPFESDIATSPYPGDFRTKKKKEKKKGVSGSINPSIRLIFRTFTKKQYWAKRSSRIQVLTLIIYFMCKKTCCFTSCSAVLIAGFATI